MSLIPEFGGEGGGGVSATSPSMTGVVTVTGTQGVLKLDTTNYSTPAIFVTGATGEADQLTLAPQSGGVVFIGANAQRNFNRAALYVRPTSGSDDVFAAENSTGSTELCRISNAGVFTVAATGVPAAGDNTTKLTTTSWTQKRIAASPSVYTFCGGL